MHLHKQEIIVAIWWTCSLLNWFMMIGYYNAKFKERLKYEDNLFWIITASLFSGIAGFLVSSWSFRFKYWGWRPYTRNEKDQMQMLKMLEGESEPTDYASGMAIGATMAAPMLLPKAKMSASKAKKGSAKARKAVPLKARTK